MPARTIGVVGAAVVLFAAVALSFSGAFSGPKLRTRHSGQRVFECTRAGDRSRSGNSLSGLFLLQLRRFCRSLIPHEQDIPNVFDVAWQQTVKMQVHCGGFHRGH